VRLNNGIDLTSRAVAAKISPIPAFVDWEGNFAGHAIYLQPHAHTWRITALIWEIQP
jgi:hypothetical protein